MPKMKKRKVYADLKDLQKLTLLSDTITPFAMITGNTVKRLNSGITPGQPGAEPVTKSTNPQ